VFEKRGKQTSENLQVRKIRRQKCDLLIYCTGGERSETLLGFTEGKKTVTRWRSMGDDARAPRLYKGR